MSTNQTLFNRYLRLIVGFGLMLRLIGVWFVKNVPIDSYTDSANYVWLGNQAASGQWLTSSDGSPNFSRPPGYPLFLGLVIKIQEVLGLDHLPLRLTAGIVQTVLAALSIWLFAQLIRRRVPVYGARLGLLTAVLFAISVDAVGWPAALMTEALSLPLLMIGCCLLLWHKKPPTGFLVGAGCVFGASILIRPANIPVAAAAGMVAVIGASWKDCFRLLGVFGLGICVLLVPWLGYAHHQTDRLLIDTTGGENWCLASSDYANGQWNSHCEPRVGVDPYEEMDRQIATAQKWALSHPGSWMQLRLQNTAVVALAPLQDPGSWSSIFYPYAKPPGTNELAFVSWFTMIITGCIAFWQRGNLAARKIRLFWQLAIITAATTVAPILFFQASRFNVGLLPLVVMSSAYWLCTTRRWPGRLAQRALARLGVAEDSSD